MPRARSKVSHSTPTVPASTKEPKASKRGHQPPARMARHKSTPKESEESLDEDVDFEIPDESSVEDSDEYQAPSDVGDESDRHSTSKSSQNIHPPDGLDSDALDEEDQDIGLDYHANSPGKKRAAHNKAVKVNPDLVAPSKSTIAKSSPRTPLKKSPAKKGTPAKSISARKRKRANDDEGVLEEEANQRKKTSAKGATPTTPRPVKKGKPADDDKSGESVASSEEFGEGLIVVGKVIQAPTTGRGKSVVLSSRYLSAILLQSSSRPYIPEYLEFPQ